MTKLNDLVDRYVSMWNEPDPDRRRQSIAALWAAGAMPKRRRSRGREQ
jgi:hypothetical protein